MLSKCRWNIRSKLSPGLENLNVLHNLYPWIPGEDEVRPAADIKQEKHKQIETLENIWNSLCDYVLHTQFGKPWKLNWAKKKYVTDYDIVGQYRFSPNEFPYALKSGHHYILWCGPPVGAEGITVSEESVNSYINRALSDMVDDKEAYDFAWYENPKMTVPDIYHVQVFWTEL